MKEKTQTYAIRGVDIKSIEKFKKESQNYRNKAILFSMMVEKWLQNKG